MQSALTGLLDSIVLTHLPTWVDGQQLLQVLLTTEERERGLWEPPGNWFQEQMCCTLKFRLILMQPFL